MSDEIEIEFVEQLKCSVCQDTIKDARILPCGHTQCKECIDGCVQASDFGGLLECPECKHSAPVANVEGLPQCAVVNDLLGIIDPTAVTIDLTSPETRAIFQCDICKGLLDDARSLPCGHSFCLSCLTKGGRQGVSCCGKNHGGAVGELPVNFRINGIVGELKNGGKKKTRPRSSELPSNGNRQGQPRGASGSRGAHEDIEKAKKRAQKGEPMEWENTQRSGAAPVNGHFRPRAHDDSVDEQKRRAKRAPSNRIQLLASLPNDKTIPLEANVNDNIDQLKRQIKSAACIDGSQQTLTFNGRNLDRGTLTLQQCGIGNDDTVMVNYKLCGGQMSSG